MFPGIPVNFSRNAEIYGESEPADYFYKVVSGTVRTSKVRIDGRRQIGGFYLPGEIFGVEIGEEHAFSAEALTDCQMLLINRRLVMARAAREAAVARELWRLIGHELERVQDHILLLIKSAEEQGRIIPAGDGRTSFRRQHSRAADDAPRHWRISRPDP